MKIPKEIQETIDTASTFVLRALVENLVKQVVLKRVALSDRADSFREVLELLRAGRISEATEVAERIVSAADQASATDTSITADLSAMRSQGSA